VSGVEKVHEMRDREAMEMHGRRAMMGTGDVQGMGGTQGGYGDAGGLLDMLVNSLPCFVTIYASFSILALA